MWQWACHLNEGLSPELPLIFLWLPLTFHSPKTSYWDNGLSSLISQRSHLLHLPNLLVLTLNFLFTPIKRSALKLNAKRWLIMTSVQQRGRQLSVRALSEGSSRMWWETTGSALCQICGSALPPVSVCSWLKPSGVAHIVLWMCGFHSTPGQQVHINILLHFQWWILALLQHWPAVGSWADCIIYLCLVEAITAVKL